MSRFIFTLHEEKLKALRRLSQDTGIPISHYLRQAIDSILDNKIPCGLVMSGSVASGYVMIMRG